MTAFRALTRMPDGRPGSSSRDYKGTVAYPKIEGQHIIGVNPDASSYTVEDEADAMGMRSRLIEKWPEVMAARNLGHKPNDALFHAEANALLRAKRSLTPLI